MSTLEMEILERFRLLDKDARRRLLTFMEDDSEDADMQEPMSPEEWQAWASSVRAELQQHYGDRMMVSSVELLDEAREERLDDLMGGR
jgi:hypothetical protein